MRLSFLLVFIFCAVTLFSCRKEGNPPAVDRPRDPWVIRSVLDQRPRMITLALHRDAYAAYDAHTCSLYKIWRGGIALNGAAYNDIKTVQPSSWGHTYWEAGVDKPAWALEESGKTREISPEFRGYTIQDQRISFRYRVRLPDHPDIEIEEQPEFDPSKTRFVRLFTTENVPEGITLLAGNHRLTPNGETKVILSFNPVPASSPPAREVSSSSSQYWLDRSGCNTCHHEDEQRIGPSYQQIAGSYSDNPETVQRLAVKVREGGSGTWGEVPMTPHPDLEMNELKNMVRYILSLDPSPKPDPSRPASASREENEVKAEEKRPGFGAPLAGVHPSYDLQTIRPKDFTPRVGAMDFLPDGRLLVATWDSLGAVYALKGVETGDRTQVSVRRLAAGLHEPLGMKVVNGEIFVMQKQELTQLIDHDQDGLTDEYRTICDQFGATADFHEFSYGLAHRDGHFFATLGIAMRLMAYEEQHPDRGTTIRIDPQGNFKIINFGLRQPNGIGPGVDGELFVLENQGQWVPASKLIHVREGDFHGCRFRTGNRFRDMEMTPPAVWLPQDEIGNSPSQPILMQDGPYKGQMLHGEVTHGGIKRVYLEKIGGAYQGAVFRFTQGMEAGINRLVWGPDGALYAGGVGMNGNWGWGDQQYGLQRLVYNGTPTFEMLAVRATPEGVEIEFTVPLAEGQGEDPKEYAIQQWRYEATARYGGPKLDLRPLPVQEVSLSADRTRARLTIPGRREGHILYLRLPETMTSTARQTLWSGDCWYTLNAIPEPI